MDVILRDTGLFFVFVFFLIPVGTCAMCRSDIQHEKEEKKGPQPKQEEKNCELLSLISQHHNECEQCPWHLGGLAFINVSYFLT